MIVQSLTKNCNNAFRFNYGASARNPSILGQVAGAQLAADWGNGAATRASLILNVAPFANN